MILRLCRPMCGKAQPENKRLYELLTYLTRFSLVHEAFRRRRQLAASIYGAVSNRQFFRGRFNVLFSGLSHRAMSNYELKLKKRTLKRPLGFN